MINAEGVLLHRQQLGQRHGRGRLVSGNYLVLYVMLKLRQLNWLAIGQLPRQIRDKYTQANRRPNVSKRGKAER